MSRALDLLAEGARESAQLMIQLANEQNFDFIIYCTFRSADEQARLFRQGRSLDKIIERAEQLEQRWKRPDLSDILLGVGPQYETNIVTKAGPGQSPHNYGLAIDAVPTRDGRPVWSTHSPRDKELWEKFGRLAEDAGFSWGGRWRFKDYVHCEINPPSWQDLIVSA